MHQESRISSPRQEWSGDVAEMHSQPASKTRKNLVTYLQNVDWDACRKEREGFFDFVREFHDKKDREVCMFACVCVYVCDMIFERIYAEIC